MSKILGKLIGVSVDGHFVDCETESALSFESDTILASPLTLGHFEESEYSRSRWTVTVNGILLRREAGADFKTIFSAWRNQQKVQVHFRTRIGIDQFVIWKGRALIINGNANAPGRGYANWNVTFKGDGPLDMDWEEFWTIIDAMPADADQPTYIDTTDWS